MSGASSLPASLPSSYCLIPIAPALSHAAAFSQAAGKRRREPEPARREALKYVGNICSHSVACSPPPYISAQGPFPKVALIPLHPDPVILTQKNPKWSNDQIILWGQVLSRRSANIHKAGGRRSPFPSMSSWVQQAGLFLRTAPDFQNWKRSGNNHAVNLYIV